MIKKTYIAASLSEAIQLIKKEMGSQASIVSTLSRPAKKTLFRFTPARIEVLASVDEKYLTQQQIELLLGKAVALPQNQKNEEGDRFVQEYRMLRDKIRKIEEENAELKQQLALMQQTQDETKLVKQGLRPVSLVRSTPTRRSRLSTQPAAQEIYDYLVDNGFETKGLKRWQESLKKLPQQTTHYQILDAAIAYFANEFIVPTQPLAPVVSFVGAKRSGKTHLIQNLADSLRQEGKSVVVLSIDKAKVEMAKIHQAGKIIDHILIDTDSVNANDRVAMRRLATRLGELKTMNILVLSAEQKNDRDPLQAFRDFHVDGLAFTCLDKNPPVGVIYNVMAEIEKPIYFFGIGPKIPDDFEVATAERLVSLLFKLDEEVHNDAGSSAMVTFDEKGALP